METAQQRTKRRKDERFQERMRHPWVRFLKYSGMAKLYRDGDIVNGLFRWYHPFNWFIILYLLVMCLFVEETFPRVMKEHFSLSKHWKDKEIEWL